MKPTETKLFQFSLEHPQSPWTAHWEPLWNMREDQRVNVKRSLEIDFNDSMT